MMIKTPRYRKNRILLLTVSCLIITTIIFGTGPDQSRNSQNISEDLRTPESAALVNKTVITPAQADSYVDSGYPFVNYGGQDQTEVGYWLGSYIIESYFRFSFEDKPANWNKAQIYLYFWGVSETQTLEVYLIEDDWTEYTLSYVNKPDKGEKICDLTIMTSFKWYVLNVSDYITPGMTNISICLTPNFLSEDLVYIDSREDAYDKPRLVWTYETEGYAMDDLFIPSYSAGALIICSIGSLAFLIISSRDKINKHHP